MSSSASKLQAASPQPEAPRHTRIGGFKMNGATATEWANRLSNRNLDQRHHSPTVYKIIRDKVLPLGADFGRVGEEAGYYMVITRSAAFDGYKDMDSSLITQFTEGSREATARKMLENEGIFSAEYEFTTMLE